MAIGFLLTLAATTGGIYRDIIEPHVKSGRHLAIAAMTFVENQEGTYLDVAVRNPGVISVVTAVEFNVSKLWRWRGDIACAPLEASRVYDVLIDTRENAPFSSSHAVSQEVRGGQADRFQVTVASKNDLCSDMVFLLVRPTLIYNDKERLAGEEWLVALAEKGLPSEDGRFYSMDSLSWFSRNHRLVAEVRKAPGRRTPRAEAALAAVDINSIVRRFESDLVGSSSFRQALAASDIKYAFRQLERDIDQSEPGRRRSQAAATLATLRAEAEQLVSPLQHLLQASRKNVREDAMAALVAIGSRGWGALRMREFRILNGGQLLALTVPNSELADSLLEDLARILPHLGFAVRLELQSASLRDVAALAAVGNLKELSLSADRIEDNRDLSRLISLESLKVKGGYDTMISLIGELSGLKELHLESTHVTELAPLVKLTALEGLSLGAVEEIEEIRALKHLKRLKVTVQSGTLGPLSSLTRIESLDLTGTGLADLEPLVGLHNLKTLVLSQVSADSFEPLADLSELKLLRLDGSSIEDLTPLQSLRELSVLDLSRTKVIDLAH